MTDLPENWETGDTFQATDLNEIDEQINDNTQLIPLVPDIVVRKTPRAVPELWTVFATKANGAAPAGFDSEQPAGVVVSALGGFVSVAPAIVNGVLTAAPSSGSNAWAFYTATLAATATRIGARFILTANTGGTDGIVTLGICNAQVTTTVMPDMSCYLSIGNAGWDFGVWAGPNNSNGGYQSLSSGFFVDALTIDGKTEYEAQVWLSGSTATIDLPDGSRLSITDSRINNSSYYGKYVFFGQRQEVGSSDNTVGFTHLMASSGTSKAPNQEMPTWRRYVALANGTTAISATTTTSTGLTIPFMAPLSGKVACRVGLWTEFSGSSSALVTLAVTPTAGGSTTNFVAKLGEAFTGNLLLLADIIATSLSPNVAYNGVIKIYTSASCSIVVSSSLSKNAYEILEPIY